MKKSSASTKDDDLSMNECRRCGCCCRKGGPSFHIEDMPIIENGMIHIRFLYTIRKGEMAHDNIKGGIFPVPTDIIKIKSRKDSQSCVFFAEEDRQCRIYDHRPLECRVLTCWNTKKIEAVYSQNRLTRKDLLSKVEGLWKLVADHQEKCSYLEVQPFVVPSAYDDANKTSKALEERIRYDIHFRHLVVEKSGIHPDTLDFLFGRPLFETLRVYGYRMGKKDN